MVIVGFAVAWAGKPAEPAEKTYTIQIQNVPHTAEVDNIRYNVFVGAVDDDMSITKKSNVVTITMPASIQQYAASLVVFRSDRDNPKIFARCALTFDNGNGPDIKTKEIVPDAIFRLYLSPKYVAKVVHELIAVGHAIENEPCVEGVTTTAHGERKLLNGYFTLVPAGTKSWLGNLTHISGAPPFAMMASAVAEDLPPTPLPGGGVTSQQPTTTPAGAEPVSTGTGVTKSAGSGNDPPAPVPPTPVQSNAPPATATLYAQVDAYIEGQNLDRTQLYQYLHQVAGYVMQGFRTAISNGSPSAARYVNLIANALNVIDDGKYLAPTLRPNWDQLTKSNRLEQNNPIPGFGAEDYTKIVDLLCSTDADSRIASQRLLRSFPADNFYQPIQTLRKHNSCDLVFVFVSQSAVYYFYNRIVEYDGKFALDAKSINWLNGNYADGGDWVTRASGKDPTQDVFGALLDYGYGITLWDRGPTDPVNRASGSSHFRLMLKTLGSSKGIYPSNPAHIAIALNEINNPGVTSTIASSATRYNAGALHPVSGNYITHGTGATLFALPTQRPGRSGMQIVVATSASICARKIGTWFRLAPSSDGPNEF